MVPRGGFKDTEDNIISAFETPRTLGETNIYRGNRQYGTGGLTWVSGVPTGFTDRAMSDRRSQPPRSPSQSSAHRGVRGQGSDMAEQCRGHLRPLQARSPLRDSTQVTHAALWTEAGLRLGLSPGCLVALSVCQSVSLSLTAPSSRRNCGGVTRTGVTGDRRRSSGDTGIRTAA